MGAAASEGGASGVGSAAASSNGSSVYNSTLAELQLGECGLGAEGGRALLQLLQRCPQLSLLHVPRNGMGAVATAALLGCCSRLRSLDVSDNVAPAEAPTAAPMAAASGGAAHAGAAGKEGEGEVSLTASLVAALQGSSSLAQLSCDSNRLGMKGLAAALDALRSNPRSALSCLSLSHNVQQGQGDLGWERRGLLNSLKLLLEGRRGEDSGVGEGAKRRGLSVADQRLWGPRSSRGLSMSGAAAVDLLLVGGGEAEGGWQEGDCSLQRLCLAGAPFDGLDGGSGLLQLCSALLEVRRFRLQELGLGGALTWVTLRYSATQHQPSVPLPLPIKAARKRSTSCNRAALLLHLMTPLPHS